MCRIPAPAVIHWVSPLVMTPPPPFESACSKTPSIMYVTVSKPRCGCHGVPFGSPGAYSTSPIWSRWMNGSRSVEVDAGERAADREALPFEAARRARDAADRALPGDGGIGLGDPRQDGDVFDDDGWHVCSTPCVCRHHSSEIVDYATVSCYGVGHAQRPRSPHTMSDFNSESHRPDPRRQRSAHRRTVRGPPGPHPDARPAHSPRQKREAPLVYSRDGDDIVIVASMGGAPRHPAWYHNIVAEPAGHRSRSDGDDVRGGRPDHRGRRAPPPLRPARRAPRQLHRVRGEDRRSGRSRSSSCSARRHRPPPDATLRGWQTTRS